MIVFSTIDPSPSHVINNYSPDASLYPGTLVGSNSQADGAGGERGGSIQYYAFTPFIH